MRVQIVDPSAYTPPYDHALCTALARAGAEVELITSRFAYGTVPAPDGYLLRELFYVRARGAAGSRRRLARKLAQHVPDMLRYRRLAASADVVHFQWLPVPWLDRRLLPRRPLVVTAHDLLPREPRPGQARAQRRLYDAASAVIVHSKYGRDRLVRAAGVDPAKVNVIHHGAFEHLAHQPQEQALPGELGTISGPVVLFFGLLRPYKGIDTLIRAWSGIGGAELWIVGRPRMSLQPLRDIAPATVRFVPGFVSESALPAYFRRAEMVVLPYSRTERFDQSGVLATALAFGKPTILTDIGGFSEVATTTGAALLVPPNDPEALREAIIGLLSDPDARKRLSEAARRAAEGAYSWADAARKTLALYRALAAPA